MNNLLKMSSVAILLAGAAVPVLADDSSSASGTSSQDSSSQMSSASSSASSSEMSSASSSEMSSASSSSASSAQSADINYGTIISAIQAGKSIDLSTITADTTITFVLVSQVKANGNTNALDNALKKNADATTKLQADVEANATLKAKLDAAGYTSSQVVAVVAGDDGSVVVVINDAA